MKSQKFNFSIPRDDCHIVKAPQEKTESLHTDYSLIFLSVVCYVGRF